MKTTSTIIKTEKPLKDVIWTTLETAAKQLKERPPGKSGFIEFDLDGCKVQCQVLSPGTKTK